ncbi:MFS transporter [Serratia fonticola]|uniref:MFS transporter n=1 Tax=Serratia fonticola TaxID=47917 RepID=UPI0034C6AAAF
MSITKQSLNYKNILSALTLSLFFILLNSGSPTPLYPLYKENFALSNTDLTLIFASYGFGVLLGLFLSRKLIIISKNTKKLLLASLMLVVVSTLCFSFARSLYSLFTYRFISGLGAGTATAIINTLLINFSSGDSAKRAALLGSLALVSGLAIGPLISSLYSQWEFYPLVSSSATNAILVFLSTIAIVSFWPKNVTINTHETRVTEDGSDFYKPLFYWLAFCVFISWSYAALILSLGPTTAIDLFGIKSPAYFGYIVTSYLLVAGMAQLTLPRLMKPEFSMILGLIVQITSMFIMLMALESRSVFNAVLSLMISGFSYGAVFIGGATLVNKISIVAPRWNAVSKFYSIIYLFNTTPLAVGWLADFIGIYSALGVSIFLFTMAYSLVITLAIIAVFFQKVKIHF